MLRKVLVIAAAMFLVAGCTRTGVSPSPTASHTQPVAATPGSRAIPSTSTASAGPRLPSWIHMVSPTVGWGLASGAVLRTANGGATWTNVSPPGSAGTIRTPDVPAINGGNGAAFLDGDLAWIPAVSHTRDKQGYNLVTVEHTANGGQSWSGAVLPVGSDGQVFLSFVSPTLGWALVDFNVATAQAASEVLGTVDGGAHWTALAAAFSPYTSPPGGSIGQGYPGDCCMSNFRFANATTGWLSGWIYPTGTPLWKTSDGGQIWRQQTLTLAPTLAAQASTGLLTVSAPVFHGAYGALCVQTLANPPKPGDVVQLFTTSDTGGTWTAGTPLPNESACSIWGSPYPGDLWIVDGSNLDLSRNSGVTWNAVTPSGLNLASTKDIDFLTATDGWAVTVNAVFRTFDGGRTWARVAGEFDRPSS